MEGRSKNTDEWRLIVGYFWLYEGLRMMENGMNRARKGGKARPQRTLILLFSFFLCVRLRERVSELNEVSVIREMSVGEHQLVLQLIQVDSICHVILEILRNCIDPKPL